MELRCPDCGAVLPVSPRVCHSCGLPLTGPVAAELWMIDNELGRLSARRFTLLSILRDARAGHTTLAGSRVPASGVPTPGVPTPGPRRGSGEVTRFAVRNVLLILGGLLLGIAAIAFTVISWSELSMGLRALILLSLTGLAMGAAWPLARRDLAATAETVAGVGLLLLVMQSYAAYAYDLFGVTGVGGRWYAAGAAALITLIWAAYGSVAPLRLILPTAVVLGQLPLPLMAYAMDASPAGAALALITVSALDLAVLRVTAASGGSESGGAAESGPAQGGAAESGVAQGGEVATVSAVMGAAAGLVGTVIALIFSFDTASPARYAGVLLSAAVVAFGWAVVVHRAAAVIGGLTLVVSLATLVPLSLSWQAAGYGSAAVVVLAGIRLLPDRLPLGRLLPVRPLPSIGRPWGRIRAATALGAGVPLLGAVLWILPGALAAVLGQAGRLDDIWTGRPGVLSGVLERQVPPAAPLVLALLAVVLIGIGRRSLTAPAVALAALSLPVVTGLPYGFSLVVMIGTAAALACWAELDREARPGAGLTAAAVTVPTALASLATEPATLAVLGALTLLATALAVVAPSLRAGAATVAVLTLGGFAAALGLSAGLPTRWAAFGVLAVSALAALVAAGLRGILIEVAGWTLAATGVVMAAGRDLELSIALALTGLIALGVAIRADRRRAAWAGSVLLLLAFWIRLGAAGVTAPEAYTMPVSAGALLVGLLRRRRDPGVSSWVVFGPGLGSTLVPSLLVAWDGTGWIRPLLLGLAALAIAFAGARYRQQAPLLLGAGVAVLDAAREVAPSVAAVVSRLPGWVPIALAGLITLLIGATYERRLRELRRLRNVVSHLG